MLIPRFSLLTTLCPPSPSHRSQVDTFLQEYAPTQHLIIEPHPDVLAFARENGWFDKPGVRFFEGTWKDYFRALEEGKEEYVAWDGVYFGACNFVRA